MLQVLCFLTFLHFFLFLYILSASSHFPPLASNGLFTYSFHVFCVLLFFFQLLIASYIFLTNIFSSILATWLNHWSWPCCVFVFIGSTPSSFLYPLFLSLSNLNLSFILLRIIIYMLFILLLCFLFVVRESHECLSIGFMVWPPLLLLPAGLPF